MLHPNNFCSFSDDPGLMLRQILKNISVNSSQVRNIELAIEGLFVKLPNSARNEISFALFPSLLLEISCCVINH